MAQLAQGVGLIGVAIVLLAYYLLASGKVSNNDVRYYWLNIIGTLALTYSLLYAWNLPAVVSQVVWILISVMGLVRVWRARGKEQAQ